MGQSEGGRRCHVGAGLNKGVLRCMRVDLYRSSTKKERLQGYLKAGDLRAYSRWRYRRRYCPKPKLTTYL